MTKSYNEEVGEKNTSGDRKMPNFDENLDPEEYMAADNYDFEDDYLYFDDFDGPDWADDGRWDDDPSPYEGNYSEE
jgi:hypothetical protein